MNSHNNTYSIYNNQAVLIISEKKIDGIVSFQLEDDKELISVLNNWLNNKDPKDILLYGENAKSLFNAVKSHFKFIKAAGGLVTNQKKEFLFIHRFGMWDLPKGKKERNEKPKHCAIREVEEETGIKELIITKKLKPTYHIYLHNDMYILKKTCWFLMETTSVELPKPQVEEDITNATWLNNDESLKALSKSYRSLKDTFNHHFLH